jgi:hypothetical protein
MKRCSLSIVAVMFLLAAALAPVASADQVYHAEHLGLSPVGGAPLRSGFVENIHPNGPNVFAHEIYVLNGAAPDSTYQVTLLIYPFAPNCSNAPAVVPTAVLQTNTSGNGRADAFLRPSDIPAALRNATHGVAWNLVSPTGNVAYRTGCTSVTLD